MRLIWEHEVDECMDLKSSSAEGCIFILHGQCHCTGLFSPRQDLIGILVIEYPHVGVKEAEKARH